MLVLVPDGAGSILVAWLFLLVFDGSAVAWCGGSVLLLGSDGLAVARRGGSASCFLRLDTHCVPLTCCMYNNSRLIHILTSRMRKNLLSLLNTSLARREDADAAAVWTRCRS